MRTELAKGKNQLQIKQLEIQAAREAAERELAPAERERARMKENVKLSVKRTNESGKQYVRLQKLRGKLVGTCTQQLARQLKK